MSLNELHAELIRLGGAAGILAEETTDDVVAADLRDVRLWMRDAAKTVQRLMERAAAA